MVENLQF